MTPKHTKVSPALKKYLDGLPESHSAFFAGYFIGQEELKAWLAKQPHAFALRRGDGYRLDIILHSFHEWPEGWDGDKFQVVLIPVKGLDAL